MKQLSIGTCSWKYPSWEGLVYSSREPADFLAEYARIYSTVEVDQWFWSLGKSGAALPRPETVAEYDAATPADFRFSVKCPNALSLTHHYSRKGQPLAANERFLDRDFFFRFLDSLQLLLPKIGLFIFQFEYLNKEKMASRSLLEDSLGRFLASLPADLPYAVELRNPRWLDATWFGFLKQTQTAPVLLQGYWMDDVAGLITRNSTAFGPLLCLRLHGQDRQGMEEQSGEDWSRIIRPLDGELDRIVAAVTGLLNGGRQIIVNVNNHYEGSAPLTIERLQSRLLQQNN